MQLINRLKKTIFLKASCLLWGSLLFSCVNEVELEFPVFENKFTLYSYSEVNSNISGIIGKSYSLSNQELVNFNELTLHIYKNDELIEQLFPNDSGYFVGTTLLEDQTDYQISLIRDGDELLLHSSMKSPDLPQIEQLSFRDSVFFDEEKMPIAHLNLTINDKGGQNFYEIILRADYYLETDNYHPLPGSTFFAYIVDPVLVDDPFHSGSLIFSNRQFEGQAYQMNIFYNRVNFGNEEDFEYRLIVSVKTISEGMYHYKKSLIKHNNTKNPDILDGFGEKVNVFTNIEGGYGVFGAYTMVVDTVYK